MPIASLDYPLQLLSCAAMGRLIFGTKVNLEPRARADEINSNKYVGIGRWDRVRAGGDALGVFKRLMSARCPCSFDRCRLSDRPRHWRRIARHGTAEVLAATISQFQPRDIV